MQFALSGQVAVSLGFTSTPGSTTGAARVVLTGVDAFGAITDASATATLRDLTVQTTLSTVAPFSFAQQGQATGTFGGMAFSVAPMGLTLRGVNGTSGATADFMNQLAFAVQVSSLGTAGAGQLMFNATVGPNAVLTQFSLLGREVSRSFAPEPAEIGLVALGLALLGWILRARRRLDV